MTYMIKDDDEKPTLEGIEKIVKELENKNLKIKDIIQ